MQSRIQLTEKKSRQQKLLQEGLNVRLNKDSEVATINIFKDLKETRLKEVKEGVIQCLTKQRLY